MLNRKEYMFIPGRYYQTRNGTKAYFLGKLKHCDCRNPLLFELQDKEGGDWHLQWYSAGGVNFIHSVVGFDIVSEWKDEAPQQYCSSNSFKGCESKKIEKLSATDVYYCNIHRKIDELVDAVNAVNKIKWS